MNTDLDFSDNLIFIDIREPFNSTLAQDIAEV